MLNYCGNVLSFSNTRKNKSSLNIHTLDNRETQQAADFKMDLVGLQLLCSARFKGLIVERYAGKKSL